MFYKKLPHISMTSETAKREVLIAPILLELLDDLDLKINIEYPLDVNEQLKGNIDYWVRSTEELVVIDIKNVYRNASVVGNNRVVFNIKGNDYRLVVKINYQFGTVYIRFIGSHKEYDKIDVSTI